MHGSGGPSERLYEKDGVRVIGDSEDSHNATVEFYEEAEEDEEDSDQDAEEADEDEEDSNQNAEDSPAKRLITPTIPSQSTSRKRKVHEEDVTPCKKSKDDDHDDVMASLLKKCDDSGLRVDTTWKGGS